MAIKLGKNPKSFKKEIKVYGVDGSKDALYITYIYRSRLYFAKLLDERAAAEDMITAQKPEQADTEAVRVSAEDQVIKATSEASANVLQIASGWDLGDEFNLENLSQLENDFPGALNEIQAQYQNAVLGVRVKN